MNNVRANRKLINLKEFKIVGVRVPFFRYITKNKYFRHHSFYEISHEHVHKTL